jgi:hypothetical protein
LDSRNKSALAGRRLAVLSALFGFELRRLLAGRAFWALLLILAPLAGYGYVEAVRLFGEASRTALQFPEMARGMTPLDGILVPTLGRLLSRHDAAVSLRRHPRPRPGPGERRR